MDHYRLIFYFLCFLRVFLTNHYLISIHCFFVSPFFIFIHFLSPFSYCLDHYLLSFFLVFLMVFSNQPIFIITLHFPLFIPLSSYSPTFYLLVFKKVCINDKTVVALVAALFTIKLFSISLFFPFFSLFFSYPFSFIS